MQTKQTRQTAHRAGRKKFQRPHCLRGGAGRQFLFLAFTSFRTREYPRRSLMCFSPVDRFPPQEKSVLSLPWFMCLCGSVFMWFCVFESKTLSFPLPSFPPTQLPCLPKAPSACPPSVVPRFPSPLFSCSRSDKDLLCISTRPTINPFSLPLSLPFRLLPP